jgi:hypothetical protein
VLLVSKDFLATSFITEIELPYLMTAAKKRGIKIGWILAADCLWEQEEFAKIQALQKDPSTPLEALPKPERTTALKHIAKAIDTLVQNARSANA